MVTHNHDDCCNYMQAVKSSPNISMSSTKGSEIPAFGSTANTVAVYRGLTVAVYNVDKSEVNLTRRDLVELINVCTISSTRLWQLESFQNSKA